MPPSRVYELQKLYFQQRQNDPDKQEGKYDPPGPIQWPDNGHFGKLNVDMDLLQQSLSPFNYSGTETVSEQVFGNELKKQHLHLQHAANLLREREALHTRHLQDIDDRHANVQEKLFGVEINNFPDRNRQLRTLEGQLIQLEQQKREEELSFWKDTVELRNKLFERTDDYRSTRQRYSILSDVEGTYG